MCDFQKLTIGEHGYVIRCLDCGYYQFCFGTAMLTLSESDLILLTDVIQQKILAVASEDADVPGEIKSVVIATPFQGICLILTKAELQNLSLMLDRADNEIKALSLLQLFK